MVLAFDQEMLLRPSSHMKFIFAMYFDHWNKVKPFSLSILGILCNFFVET